MKAIILAAGAGRRLAPMGWNRPKCLLEVDGMSILGNMLTAIRALAIRHVFIVVGFRRELVEREARRYDPNVTLLDNAEFARTNTIHSLYLARAHFDEGFYFFNGDVWFESALLQMLRVRDSHEETENVSAIAVDENSRDAEAVKVVMDPDGRVRRLGKDVPATQCHGEFIGLARFDVNTAQQLRHSLCRYNEVLGKRSLFFEAALNDILDECRVVALPVGSHLAMEIDTPEDYQRLLEKVKVRSPQSATGVQSNTGLNERHERKP